MEQNYDREAHVRPEIPNFESDKTPNFAVTGDLESANAQDSAAMVAAAETLYAAGLNVFPVQHGSKEPYGPHAFLEAARIYGPCLPDLVWRSNIAVKTGRLSGNLFVLDCDTKEAFDWTGKQLTAKGIDAWVRGGARGGQYWLRCAEGEVANAGKRTNGRSVETLGNRLYAVAPPSVHPCGVVYEWIARPGDAPPVVSIRQVDLLPVRLAFTCGRGGREKGSALPPVANEVLIERDTSGCGGDNSLAEYTACWSLISAGWSDGQILQLFAQTNPAHYAKVGEANFRAHILTKARAVLSDPARAATAWDGQAGSAQEARAASLSLSAWALSRPWPGRTGNSDRDVYGALCKRLGMDGKADGGQLVFRGSVREVAELAGVSKTTAEKAINRLVAAGLVRAEDCKTASSASRFSLMPRPEACLGILKTHLGTMESQAPVFQAVGDALCAPDAGNLGDKSKPAAGNFDVFDPTAGNLDDEFGIDVLEEPSDESIAPASEFSPADTSAMGRRVETGTVLEEYNTVRTTVPVSTPHDDAWNVRALGKSAYAIWEALHTKPRMSETEIAARTGKTKWTVKNVLKRLETQDLVRWVNGAWEPDHATQATLGSVAYECGSRGPVNVGKIFTAASASCGRPLRCRKRSRRSSPGRGTVSVPMRLDWHRQMADEGRRGTRPSSPPKSLPVFPAARTSLQSLCIMNCSWRRLQDSRGAAGQDNFGAHFGPQALAEPGAWPNMKPSLTPSFTGTRR